MVHAYSKIFGTRKPVFDGRSNLYTRDPLPIGSDAVELEVTLPGEGKDRVFRVTMKWAAQVGLNLHIELRTFVSTDHQETFDLSTSFFMVSGCSKQNA